MTIVEFRQSLSAASDLPLEQAGSLAALWHDARGDWDVAHRIAQDHDSTDGSRVHAYLHRKEGNLSNALYWYRRAGRPESRASLTEEWEEIALHLLESTE